MIMAENNVYYNALLANLAKINEAVGGSGAPNVGQVATHLMQENLIGEADYQTVLDPSGEALTRIVGRMFNVVLMKLKHQPNKQSNYQKLLTVLKSKDFGFLADELEKSRLAVNPDLVSQETYSKLNNSMAKPITALDIIYGRNAQPREGFRKIPVDLNKGALGEFIYLCYSVSQSGPPITNIQVFAADEKEFPIQKGYEKIPMDLNKGAMSGKFIYLCYTRSKAFQPVTAVNVIQGDSQAVYPETEDWIRIDQDTSHGARGDYTYVVFKR